LAAVPLVATGVVSFSLGALGVSQASCLVGGRAEPCSDVFWIRNGTVTCVMNEPATMGDGSAGSYSYSCALSGYLDCSTRELVGGWVQCTVCAGLLADASAGCSAIDDAGDEAGVGGQFAGPLAASYDTATLTFIGTWNGADGLAGYDAGSPATDPRPVPPYLSLDGGYGDGNYGGSGTWTGTP
jgi:hypothetical protein